MRRSDEASPLVILRVLVPFLGYQLASLPFPFSDCRIDPTKVPRPHAQRQCWSYFGNPFINVKISRFRMERFQTSSPAPQRKPIASFEEVHMHCARSVFVLLISTLGCSIGVFAQAR